MTFKQQWRALIIGALAVLYPLWSADAAPETETRIFYFHRTGRCPTCMGMEEWARQVVGKLSSDTNSPLVLNAVNLDLPEYAHYAEDFKVTFSTVVIAEMQEQKAIRWKNLTNLWDFAHDEENFKKYIETECMTFKSDEKCPP